MSFTDYVLGLARLKGKRCIYCGAETNGGMLCEECAKKENALRRECFGEGVYRVFEYGGIVRELIHQLKYSSRPIIALHFAREAARAIEKSGLEFDAVTFVPVHKRRKAVRGYDQSELMAQFIAADTGKAALSLLKRVKNTKPQFSLSKKQRAENLKDAFVFDGEKNGGRVLLTDDICTTGTTMESCARILEQNGYICVKFAVAKELGFDVK